MEADSNRVVNVSKSTFFSDNKENHVEKIK